MAGTSVEQLMEDLHGSDPEHYGIVQLVRELVRAAVPDVEERVQYGGIMFAGPLPFCGVFSHREHVSVEFGRGCDLADPRGVLEGSGKLRRHIKLRTRVDLAAKQVGDYIAQAHAASLSV